MIYRLEAKWNLNNATREDSAAEKSISKSWLASQPSKLSVPTYANRPMMTLSVQKRHGKMGAGLSSPRIVTRLSYQRKARMHGTATKMSANTRADFHGAKLLASSNPVINRVIEASIRLAPIKSTVLKVNLFCMCFPGLGRLFGIQTSNITNATTPAGTLLAC